MLDSDRGNADRLAQAIANLDAWLETMRMPGGYDGPVVHWWQNCLSYTGPGLDWRYEGIILGYLTLWQCTAEERWLEKACRAADDLVGGQLPNGNYRHSAFEQNPYSGGTPHEAAADLGLLRLAIALRGQDDARWQRYAAAAARNLRCYYLDRLWDEAAQSFRDHPYVPSLVPNKACTLAEALFAWAKVEADDEPVMRFALPTLEAVLALQVQRPGALAGAIPQDVQRGRVTEKYFPYYIARCMPALLQAHDFTAEERWLAAAAGAMAFVGQHMDEQGLLPQVVYRRGVNRYPQWLAPLGDVLRAGRLLSAHGIDTPLEGMHQTLLDSQLASGGLPTARGFGFQVRQRPRKNAPADFRDALPVAGWVDKAFRYLAACLPDGTALPAPHTGPYWASCSANGRDAIWQETADAMTLSVAGREMYRWRKGEPWATAAPEVGWK